MQTILFFLLFLANFSVSFGSSASASLQESSEKEDDVFSIPLNAYEGLAGFEALRTALKQASPSQFTLMAIIL